MTERISRYFATEKEPSWIGVIQSFSDLTLDELLNSFADRLDPSGEEDRDVMVKHPLLLNTVLDWVQGLPFKYYLKHIDRIEGMKKEIFGRLKAANTSGLTQTE